MSPDLKIQKGNSSLTKMKIEGLWKVHALEIFARNYSINIFMHLVQKMINGIFLRNETCLISVNQNCLLVLNGISDSKRDI